MAQLESLPVAGPTLLRVLQLLHKSISIPVDSANNPAPSRQPDLQEVERLSPDNVACVLDGVEVLEHEAVQRGLIHLIINSKPVVLDSVSPHRPMSCLQRGPPLGSMDAADLVGVAQVHEDFFERRQVPAELVDHLVRPEVRLSQRPIIAKQAVLVGAAVAASSPRVPQLVLPPQRRVVDVERHSFTLYFIPRSIKKLTD